MSESCSICGFKVAWCVDPDDKGTYWLCGECAASQVMESFLEKQALLRVARAAKEMTDIHHVSGGVRVCPVTTQILDALKELPEGLLD